MGDVQSVQGDLAPQHGGLTREDDGLTSTGVDHGAGAHDDVALRTGIALGTKLDPIGVRAGGDL